MVLVPAGPVRRAFFAPGKYGLECGDAGAVDADVDFDHGPDVDGHAVVEGVFGLRVDADRVQPHNRRDAAEDTEPEDANEGDFLASRPLDGEERLDRQGNNPYVCKDVETRSGWQDISLGTKRLGRTYCRTKPLC